MFVVSESEELSNLIGLKRVRRGERCLALGTASQQWQCLDKSLFIGKRFFSLTGYTRLNSIRFGGGGKGSSVPKPRQKVM